MKKTHSEIVNTEKVITDEILCNRCGKPINTYRDRCGITQFTDYIAMSTNVIRHQREFEHIDDFELCENCIKEILGEFKIPVKVSSI